jgi:hypothetical protein
MIEEIEWTELRKQCIRDEEFVGITERKGK